MCIKITRFMKQRRTPTINDILHEYSPYLLYECALVSVCMFMYMFSVMLLLLLLLLSYVHYLYAIWLLCFYRYCTMYYEYVCIVYILCCGFVEGEFLCHLLLSFSAIMQNMVWSEAAHRFANIYIFSIGCLLLLAFFHTNNNNK